MAELKPELWLPIPGYEGYYEASNHGRIRSVDRIVGGVGRHRLRGKLKSFCLSGPKGRKYYYVNLYKDCKGHLFSVHRIIGKLFVPNPNNYKLLNHKDNNPLNNYFENFEWCTTRENISHGGLCNGSKRVGIKKYVGKRVVRYTSSIGINGKTKYLGTFETEEQAASAYRNALAENKIENRYAY
jgi:hypothetical protein